MLWLFCDFFFNLTLMQEEFIYFSRNKLGLIYE